LSYHYKENFTNEDLKFSDPLTRDFIIEKKRIIKKIDFQPFDYKSYGVYENKDWISKTKLPNAILDKFNALFIQ